MSNKAIVDNYPTTADYKGWIAQLLEKINNKNSLEEIKSFNRL